MAELRDFGIAWMVLLAAIFWISVWNHQAILNWMGTVWMNAFG
jgi:hypothetical protein